MNKILVTKEEFQALTNDYWNTIFTAPNTLTEKELKQLKDDEFKKLDEYEIKGIEGPHHPNIKFSKLISAYCVEMRRSDYIEDKFTYFGAAGEPSHIKSLDDSYRPNISKPLLDELGFIEKYKWRDCGRRVFVSDSLRSILTFCSGDLSITVNGTPEAYRKDYGECVKCYEYDN
ncbi:hypothetical protein CN918_31275 [Priestia megaterium]|nr:hypothetical protein CN918_31275 [Priestia megaterium]